MAEWIFTTLGETTIIKMGQSPPSSSYNVERRGLPFFQGKSEFTELHPIVKKWCDAPKKIAEKGDILLSVRAPVGATNIANQKCAIGRGLVAISYQYCNKYLFYYLRYSERKLQKLGTGTTFKAISKSDIEEHHFPLPPLPEQRAIVARIEELFSRLDKGVETLQKVKEQLKVYRQAVLKWAFEGKLTEEWRALRQAQGTLPTAEELLEQIKAERERHYQQKLAEWQKAVKEWEARRLSGVEVKGKKPAKPKKLKELAPLTEEELTELPELPKEWVWVKLRYLGDLISGQHILAGNYSNEPIGIPYLTGPADFSSKYPIISKWTLNPKAIANKNAVLITVKGAGVGKVNILDVEKAAISRQLMAFNGENLNPLFLFYYFVSKFQKFQKLGLGSTVPGIDRENILNILVPVASLREQQAIVQEIETRLSVADRLEQIIDESLQKAEALRQSILKKAFEGKLLSEAEREALKNDPEWEPAKKLLERIKAEKEAQEKTKQTSRKNKK